MPEYRKNFTENINQKNLNELKEYLLSFKESKDEIYNPKTHPNWEESVILIEDNIPARWCIFRIYIDEKDLSIYSFSDENGNVALPNVTAKEYDVDIIHTSDKYILDKLVGQPIKKTDWEIEFWGIVLALIIGYIYFILPGQIRQYKLNEEQELINNVVSKPYADFENYRSQIINKVHSLERETPFIYVYTNDTKPLEFNILPNVSIYQNNDNYSPHFSTKRMQADDLKYFLDNEDAEGYNIWLNTTRTPIVIGNYKKTEVLEFNVSMSYFYSEKTKEHLKKQAKKRKKLLNIKTKNRDSIQTARVIFTKDFKVKPRNKLSGLLMGFDEKIIQSAIKKKNPTQKTYLSFYSKNSSKEEFESIIEKFEKFFLDGKKSKNYKIRKVYLKK